MTTIKQYGSLTLDLNTVKQIYLVGTPWGSQFDVFQIDIRLNDNTKLILDGKWRSQIFKDFENFTLQKKSQVIKKAFEYVFDTEFQIAQHSEYNPTSYTLKSKQFWIYLKNNNSFCCSTRQTGSVEGQLTNFDFNSTDKATWIGYAQQIKDKYLDSIVDPVKVANQVLKFRKLDSEWKTSSTKPEYSLLALELSGKEKIIFYIGCLSTLVAWSESAGKNYLDWQTPPITNFEWIAAIEIVLDKYYESQQLSQDSKVKQRPTEVDLKLMLGKALKDNGLVAKEVIINVDSNCPNKISLTINNDKLKWLDLNTNQIAVYANELSQPIGVYSYTNLKDWEVIFFDSLNQYKQLSKLTSSKLIKEFLNKEPTLIDLIKQAFPSYQWSNSGNIGSSNCISGLCYTKNRTIKVIVNSKEVVRFVLEIKQEQVINVETPNAIFTKDNLTNYTNWEQWLEDLIKVKQNLKDLEQSPNLVVKEVKKHSQIPQRVKGLGLSDYHSHQMKDPWS